MILHSHLLSIVGPNKSYFHWFRWAWLSMPCRKVKIKNSGRQLIIAWHFINTISNPNCVWHVSFRMSSVKECITEKKIKRNVTTLCNFYSMVPDIALCLMLYAFSSRYYEFGLCWYLAIIILQSVVAISNVRGERAFYTGDFHKHVDHRYVLFAKCYDYIVTFVPFCAVCSNIQVVKTTTDILHSFVTWLRLVS